MSRNFYKKYFLVLLFIAVIVLINKYLLADGLPNVVYGLAEKPGALALDYFGKATGYGRGLLSSGLRISQLIAENHALESEKQSLISQMAGLQKIERENTRLREQLALPLRIQHQLLEAKIFSLNQNGLTSTLLINKGMADGVRKSMAAVSRGNILAGTVDRVFEDYAQILLLDDPRSAISVKVGQNNVIAAAIGSGKPGGLILDLVTNQETIKEGDPVLTSGLDSLPEFLSVGEIVKVELKGGNLFRGVRGRLGFYPLTDPNLFLILR